MGDRSIYLHNHEFQFMLTATQKDGWTMNVLHIDHSRAQPTELRSVIDIEFESEAEALRYAEIVAAKMAQRSDQPRGQQNDADGEARHRPA